MSDRAGESPRIAVVGAGPAGLTAALRLQRRGSRVRVLEARGRVGGRSFTDELEGCRVDAGAQLMGSMFTRTLDLVREVGLGPSLVRAPGRDALWRGGRAHEVVYGSVTSMITSGGLPMRTKLHLGTTYVPFLNRHAGALDLHAPERASFAGLDSESIAEWGSREMGADFVDYLAHPQLAAFYGATAAETSAGFYHILARGGMDVSLYALRGGMGSLCDALAAAVRESGGEVRTGTPVRRLARGDGEGGVRLSGEWGEEEFDAAVVAVPAPAAADLLADPAAPLAHWLSEVRTRPALTLALVLDRPLGVRYFGLSFPRGAAPVVSAVSVPRNNGAGMVPEDRGLLLAFVSPDAVPGLIEAEARTILDRVLPEVERAFPAAGERLLRARVYRWPEGLPVFYPGYLGRLAAFRGGGIEGDAPYALAGDYLYSPSVEGAVASGIAAAERLLARLEAASI